MATVGTVVFPEGLFHGIRPHQDVAIYGTVHATTLGIRSHLKQSWLCDDMRDEVPLLAVENDDLALARMDREELVTRHIRHSVRIEAGCVHDYSRVQRSPVGADAVIRPSRTFMSTTMVSRLTLAPFRTAFSAYATVSRYGDMIPVEGICKAAENSCVRCGSRASASFLLIRCTPGTPFCLARAKNRGPRKRSQRSWYRMRDPHRVKGTSNSAATVSYMALPRTLK